jgi:hypothetical protein
MLHLLCLCSLLLANNGDARRGRDLFVQPGGGVMLVQAALGLLRAAASSVK